MTSLTLALFVLIALAARSNQAKYTCGSSCECYDGDFTFAPGFKVAQCDYFATVPTNLPADIQDLHIWYGSISRLNDSQFTSYRQLQLIRIISSKIEQIEPESFRYMTNVTYIDLNYNQISELPTEFLTFSPNLVTVYLRANKIKRLQSHLFNNLKYLKEVYLNNNEIVTVEEHCFAEVPQLEQISLNNNKLISLDIKFIDNPTSLKYLYLKDNPWHCDTSLCGVLDIVVNLEPHILAMYGPTCTTPQNLTGRKGSQSLRKELCSCFFCNCTNVPPQPQPSCDVGPLIISNTSSVSEGQDMQLKCKYCFPYRVVWTYNDVTLPSRYVEQSEESLTSTLTITNVVRGQQGYYLCKIRSCEDCRNDGVYVSVTGKPQSDVDLKQIVHVPGVNSSESRSGILLQNTVVPATELNITLNDKN